MAAAGSFSFFLLTLLVYSSTRKIVDTMTCTHSTELLSDIEYFGIKWQSHKTGEFEPHWSQQSTDGRESGNHAMELWYRVSKAVEISRWEFGCSSFVMIVGYIRFWRRQKSRNLCTWLWSCRLRRWPVARFFIIFSDDIWLLFNDMVW